MYYDKVAERQGVSARQKGKANRPRMKAINAGRKEVGVCNPSGWSRRCRRQSSWHRCGGRKVKVFRQITRAW